MPIDINLLRKEKGGNIDVVLKSQERRGAKPELVEKVLELDPLWRKARYDLDKLNAEAKAISKVVADKMKKSKGQDPCEEEKKQATEINEKVEQQAKVEKELHTELQSTFNKIGNIVADDVPVSKDEKDNLVVTTWGKIEERKIDGTLGNLHHHQVMRLLDAYDPERGQKIVGHRGYFLKGYGVLLNQALINYGLNFLTGKGYTVLQPPFFMKQSVMAETAQLSDFDEALYKVTGGKDEEPFYLIATSEQPISGYFRKEWIKESELPIRFAGISSCFRKEAGAHGKDMWGIFRIHQFEKVEQFVLTTPEKSWEMHEEMIKASEEFYQGLKLPYRVVSIVSGALNDAAAKKLDLEAWFPGYNAYRELVSCSNCTDYQARALEVRCGIKQNEGEKRYVHMLNATLSATERTLCCLLENYQDKDGVHVPEVLVPYMNGVKFLPYNMKLADKWLPEFKKEKH